MFVQRVTQGELITGSRVEVEASNKPHVTHNGGNVEWYTPADYIEAARTVLGSIDLDPASSHQANEVVKAATYYNVETDGLAQGWQGKVWMNPPYTTSLITRFVAKLCSHFAAGDVREAIVLVNNATETAWAQRLARYSSAICLLERRVKFWGPRGSVGSPLQGQMLFYLGANPDNFRAEFIKFGQVMIASGHITCEPDLFTES